MGAEYLKVMPCRLSPVRIHLIIHHGRGNSGKGQAVGPKTTCKVSHPERRIFRTYIFGYQSFVFGSSRGT